jgi:hypothetical protein
VGAPHIGKRRLHGHHATAQLALIVLEVFTLSANRHTFLPHFFRCKGGVFSHTLCRIFSTFPEAFTAAFILILHLIQGGWGNRAGIVERYIFRQ